MTRRRPDISKPRGETGTSTAIGAGLGMLAGVIALVIAGAIVVALLSVRPARAHDSGQWENSDPHISLWYRDLKQPDNPSISCCGEADAYWADRIEVEGAKVFAIVTDDRADEPFRRPHVPIGTRIEVPPHKLKYDAGNPSGHTVIFLGPGLLVWCFVQSSGI